MGAVGCGGHHVARWVGVLARSLVGMAWAAGPVQAQDRRPEPVPPAQAVVITGSRLATSGGADEISPVQVLTSDDIRRSGAATLRELLSTVAAVTGIAGDVDTGGSMAPGASSVELRHLGRQATLVLLNGRRVSPYPLADFGQVITNLDALPLAAIERIEILKAGASAIYGSDAIAGVIHLITKTAIAGRGELLLGHARSIRTGRLGESQAALTLGWGDNGGVGEGTGTARGPQVLASLELYTREPLFWGDAMQHVNPAVTAYSPSYGTPSSYSWPGNLIGAGPLPGCATVQAGLCMYDRYSRFEAMPSARRASVFVEARQELDAHRSAFGELLLAHTETLYRGPLPLYQSGATVQWVDPNTQSVRSFYFPGLPAAHPLNTLGVDGGELRYRFVDGPGQLDARTLQYRALAGLKSVAGATDWEAAVGAMGGATRARGRGAFSASGFEQMIGSTSDGLGAPDFFSRGYRLGGANSAEVIDTLFPEHGHQGRVNQVFGDLRWRSVWDSALLGAVQLGAGADLRHEAFSVTPSDGLMRGDIVGAGLARTDASRWVLAGHAEALAPIGPDATLRLAARVDRYQGVAPRVSPLLALRYSPSDALTLRGGVEYGFRAPNLVERSNSAIYNVAGNVADPARCLPALALYRDLAAAAATLPPEDPLAIALLQRAITVLNTECQSSISRITQHNPALKPETSRGLSLGLLFKPWPAWQFSADYWDLQQRQQIASLSVQGLLASEALLAPGRVVRGALLPEADRSFSAAEVAAYGVAAGPLRSVTVQFDNLDRVHVQGLDLAAKGRLPTAWGNVSLQLDASRLLRARLWDVGSSAWSSNLAGQGDYRRWRATLQWGLERGRWQHTLVAQVHSGETLDAEDTTCAASGLDPRLCREAGWTRWDYAVAWRPAPAWTLRAHVHNVFNKRQPVNVARWLAAGGLAPPTLADAQGRMLQVSAAWRF